MEGHGFSGAGGLAGGVENLHDDNVGVEGGEVAFRLQFAADDRGQVVEGLVFRRRERWRREGDFG